VSTERALFETELAKIEAIAGFRHGLDLKYQSLCEAARRDWERLFSERDPADACVTVRVTTITSRAVRGSGFLKSRRQPRSKARGLPRFAH
jgi:hypothetical protein